MTGPDVQLAMPLGNVHAAQMVADAVTRPRRFYLQRNTDVNGVSGEGRVAWGVRFPSGIAVLHWCVPNAANSTAVYASIDDLVSIHGHGGATALVWLD